MNEELSEVPEDLQCIICMDVYVDPVNLTCGHSFCRGCILDLVRSKPSCPTCKFPHLSGGLGLKSNFALRSLIESKYQAHVQKRLQEDMRPTKPPANSDDQALLLNIPLLEVDTDDLIFPLTLRQLKLPDSISLKILTSLFPNSRCLVARKRYPNTLVTLVEFLAPQNQPHDELQFQRDNRSETRMVRGVGRYSVVNVKEIDVCENDEVRNSVLLETGLTKYTLKLADAKELTDLPVLMTSDRTQEFQEEISYIRQKINHLMNRLRLARESTYWRIRNTHSFAFLEEYQGALSQNYLTSFGMSSVGVLRMPLEQKLALLQSDDCLDRITAVRLFLRGIDINAEPLSVLESEEYGSHSSNLKLLIGLLLVILSVVIYNTFLRPNNRKY